MMNEEDSKLRLLVVDVFQVTPGAPGEITLFDCISKDFIELTNAEPEVENIKDAFCRISLFLNKGKRELVEIDSYQLKSITSATHRQFVFNAPLKSDKTLIPLMRSIRASILISLLRSKSKISRKLAETVRHLFDGTYYQFIESCNSLHDFASLPVDFERHPDFFKLVARIQSILREGYYLNLDATLDSPITIVTLKPPVVTATTTDEVLKQPKRFYTKVHTDGDLLAKHTNEFNFATPRDFSGVPNQYKSLNNNEIIAYFNHVIKEHRKTESLVLLAIMLSFHLRVGPAHFNLVRLEFSPGHNFWIDLNNDCLCWNRLAFVKGMKSTVPPQEKDIFRIPLPSQLMLALKKQHKLKGGRKLGDIFGDTLDLIELKEACKQYAFKYTLSAHRPILIRIARGVGRFILQVSKDDVYASIISLDFTLSTQSSFYYFVSDPSRINEICRAVYLKIGYEPEQNMQVFTPTGSMFARSSHEVAM